MKKNKILKCSLALILMFAIILSPASKANAVTKGIATLEVECWYRTWAFAATQSVGYVTVDLSVTIYNGNTDIFDAEGSGNMTGYAHVSIPAGTDNVITYANSWHTDSYGHMTGTWRPPDDYYLI